MNPEVQRKLQAELDQALGPTVREGDLINAVATFDQVKSLPYLEACINEGLRIHSTSAMGLPRVVPAGGLIAAGRFFPQGSILSVPSFTIHRDRDVWGDDADVFRWVSILIVLLNAKLMIAARPERWFERDKDQMLKTFNPFSWGPRACVGKNLATMELLIIIGTLLKRYDFTPREPDVPVRVLHITSFLLSFW